MCHRWGGGCAQKTLRVGEFLVNFFMILAGALTAKYSAFRARSWELRNVEAIDFFDALGSLIRIDVRGQEILRVLPRVHSVTTDEWISDKVRFSHDFLRRQRLLTPFLKIRPGNLISVSWRSAQLYFLQTFFSKEHNLSVQAVVGNFLDKETLISFSLFLKTYFKNYTLRFSNSLSQICSNEFRTDYLLPDLQELSRYTTVILGFLNPRLEVPLVNVRLRALAVSGSSSVCSFGPEEDLTYAVVSLGFSLRALLYFLSFRHSWFKFFLRSRSNNVLILLGASSLRITSSLYSALKLFRERLISYHKKHVSFFLIPENLGSISFSELPFVSGSVLVNKQETRFRFLYLLDSDEIEYDPLSYSMVVFQGHHGSFNAANADLVLPSTAPFEKSSSFMTVLGLSAVNPFVLLSGPSVRADWFILNVFIFLLTDIFSFCFALGSVLLWGFVRLNLLREFIVDSFGSFFAGAVVAENEKLVSFPASLCKIYNAFIPELLDNFYTADVLSRASQIMSLSYSRFVSFSTFK